MKRHVFQESGVTLLELTVAAGLMASVTAVVLQLLLGGRTAFVVQPERADVHQRLRVAVDLVSRDLRVAGTGLVRGDSPVPLWSVMPAVRPARRACERATTSWPRSTTGSASFTRAGGHPGTAPSRHGVTGRRGLD